VVTGTYDAPLKKAQYALGYCAGCTPLLARWNSSLPLVVPPAGLLEYANWYCLPNCVAPAVEADALMADALTATDVNEVGSSSRAASQAALLAAFTGVKKNVWFRPNARLNVAAAPPLATAAYAARGSRGAMM